MKVSIKDFSIQMEIKNNGVEFEVRDNSDKHLGDVYVTKTGLTVCQGRTQRENGKKISWKDIFKMADS